MVHLCPMCGEPYAENGVHTQCGRQFFGYSGQGPGSGWSRLKWSDYDARLYYPQEGD